MKSIERVSVFRGKNPRQTKNTVPFQTSLEPSHDGFLMKFALNLLVDEAILVKKNSRRYRRHMLSFVMSADLRRYGERGAAIEENN